MEEKSLLKLMYITNDPTVAMIADKYGVDRVWIDLERLGKEERQKNMNSVKSFHSVSDIETIKPLLKNSEMLVRVNPWHEGSKKEIDDVIKAGADIIMLPYWKSLKEVDAFLNAVSGRCKTTLLLENKDAMECADDVLKNGGFDEIHIGLNDLHLSLGMTFMFELLADGTVERLCEKFKEYNIPYGFGGIARLGYGLLPAEMVIKEHYRLGSTRAILSRAFCDSSLVESSSEIETIFSDKMNELRKYEISMKNVTDDEFLSNKKEVSEKVALIVSQIKEKQND